MAGIGGYKKKAKGNRGYKMAGSPFSKKAGPETKKFDIDDIAKPKITSQDEEDAYENAQNDYDTDHPTKSQLAKALRKVKAERKAGY